MSRGTLERYSGPVRCGQDVIAFGRLDQCGEPARYVERVDGIEILYCGSCARRELYARHLETEVSRDAR